MKRAYAEDVFHKLGLIVRWNEFECPYCQHTAPRGGHAEGFRKSGMNNHVHVCWEIGLYLRGYLIGSWIEGAGKQEAIPLGVVKDREPAWWKRAVRGIKATMRRRAKDGELDVLRPTSN